MGKPDWEFVRDSLAARIAQGTWAPGDRLPSEPALCAAFDVGRHSLRRAIHALAVAGALRPEQGRGTFVQSAPLISYAIGRRTRFSQNIAAQGLAPGGAVIAAQVLAAPPPVAQALHLPPGTPVHRITARGSADGVPVSLGLSWHPAGLFPDLGARRLAGESVSAIYRANGIPDYLRRSTILFSRRAEPEEAAALQQHPDQPVTVISKVDETPAGLPIGCSDAIWAGARVQFVLTNDDRSPSDD